MATKERSIIDTHQLDRQKNVNLTITIGNLQIGGSIVKWSTQPNQLQSNELGKGTINNLFLGKGSDLVGKKLLITTKFYDCNLDTNNIAAMYNFNNGAVPVHVYYDHVDDQGDFFIFNIEITFL